MLKKAKAEAAAQASAGRSDNTQGKALADSVLESSRQIWLAGLGAFARAKGEGTKVFESLVEQGQALESRTKKAASDTAAAARDAAQGKAREMQAKAGGTWDKLEQVFEDRVARALSRLGVHTQSDVARLTERVDALSEAVNALIKAEGAAPRTRNASKPKRASQPRLARKAGDTASKGTKAAKGATK